MTIREKLDAYDFFDESIMKLGFKKYLRDFEIIAYLHSHETRGYYSYLFKGAVDVNYKCVLSSSGFSLDDKNINFAAWEKDPEGYMWVDYASAYPGWRIIEDDEKTRNYSNEYRYEFTKILIETNVFKLEIIFNDVDISFMGEEAGGLSVGGE